MIINTELIKSYIRDKHVRYVTLDGVNINELEIDDLLWYPCYKGHTASDWIIDTEPTTVTEGSKHKECTVCGEILETATIPKLEPLTYTLSSDGTYYSVKATDTYISGDIVIPSTYNDKPVTTIESEAFCECKGLTGITIPNSITHIPYWAFARCSNLATIVIPDSVTSIGTSAFADCSSITSITIPNSVTSIGSGAFDNCSSLTSITIGNGVTEIDDLAFELCSSLISVVIPDSVTSMGSSVFYGCDDLTHVYYKGTASDIAVDPHNDKLISTLHYYSEAHPTEKGNFWHYVDGVPTVWCCDIIVDEAVAATCTTTGLTEGSHCGVCGTVIKAQTIVKALGHDYSDWIVSLEPSCSTTGTKSRRCRRCETVENMSTPSTGHSYTSVVTAPTCTEQGYTTHTCSKCNHSYKDTYTDATGHTWGAWTIELKPTCTTTGRNTRTCKVCSAPDVQIVPATGHTSVNYPTVAATCTTAGYTGGTYCSKCNAVLTERTTLPAIGHIATDWIIDTEPTIEAEGSQHKECTVCGAVLETATIPKLDNNTYLVTESGEFLTDEQGNKLMI